MAFNSEAAPLQAQVPLQLLQPPPSLWQATLTDPTPVASLGGPIQTQQQQALLQGSQNGGPATIVHLGSGNVQQVLATPGGCASSAGPFGVPYPVHADQDSLQAPAFVSNSGSPFLVAGQQRGGTGMQQQPAAAPASAGGPQPLLLCAPPPPHGWVQVSSGAQQGGALGSQVLTVSTGGGIANTGTIQQGDASNWVVLGQPTGCPPSIHQHQPQVPPLQLQQVLLLPADMQPQHQQQQQQVLLLPADMQPQHQQQQHQVLLPADMQHQQQVLPPADMQHVLLPPAFAGAPDLSAPEAVLSFDMTQLRPQQMLPPQAQTILLHAHPQPQAQTIMLHPHPQPQHLHLQHNQQQQLGYAQQQLLPERLRQPPPRPPTQQQQQHPVVWLQPPPPPRRAGRPLPPAQQQEQQQSYTPANPDSSLFFTGVSPAATAEDLLRVCAQYGHVKAIDLYRSYKGCRMSKGCGVVEYSARSEAGAALVAMHGRLLWPGTSSPMVVEWYRHGARRHSRAGVAGQQQQQQVALNNGTDVGSGATFTAAGVVAGAGAVGGSSDGASAAAAAAASGGGDAVEQPGQPAATDSAAASTTHCPPAACPPSSPTAQAPAPGAA